MGKSRVEPKLQGTPQRRLNIIYFIDSAKTRSVTVPIGRLVAISMLILLVFIWSFASVFVISWLGYEQRNLSLRLKSSLSTIFEYQARFDNVYEIAYPPSLQLPDATYDPATASLRSENYTDLGFDKGKIKSVSESKEIERQDINERTNAKEPAPSTEHQGQTGPQALSLEVKETKIPGVKVANVDDSSVKPKDLNGQDFVTVGNMYIERSGNNLLLHLELTNLSGSTRVEGYIWSVAEFVGDDGQKAYIGAPKTLSMNSKGEPRNPEKATYFGIKRFKKQTFSFPLIKDRSGLISGVKIGVMNLSGQKKKTYRLSTEFPVR